MIAIFTGKKNKQTENWSVFLRIGQVVNSRTKTHPQFKSSVSHSKALNSPESLWPSASPPRQSFPPAHAERACRRAASAPAPTQNPLEAARSTAAHIWKRARLEPWGACPDSKPLRQGTPGRPRAAPPSGHCLRSAPRPDAGVHRAGGQGGPLAAPAQSCWGSSPRRPCGARAFPAEAAREGE